MLVGEQTTSKAKKPGVPQTPAPEPLPPVAVQKTPLSPGITPSGPPVTSTAPASPAKTPLSAGLSPVPGGILTSSAGDGFGSTAQGPAASPQAPQTALPPAPAPTALPPVPAAPTAAPGPGNAVSLTPTNPANPLTMQTIGAGNLADRFGIATQRFDDWSRSTAPQYAADLRQATRLGAGAGQLGSGELRTDYGNLANQRALQMDTAKSGFLGNALEDSIGDAWRGVEQANQQQGFQAGQQQQLFGNELARLGIGDQLDNSDFTRALQTWMAGNTGGTGANTALAGSNIAGNNSNDALSALQAWLAARNAQPVAPEPTPLRPLPGLPSGTSTTVGRP